MTGAVAIWHDIAPEGLAEFYAWHGQEHMPERVSIPGFRSGRRFVSAADDLQFFNLYETDSLEVVLGPDYKERLDNPTVRTLSAVRHFRHVARSLCRVMVKHTSSQSGVAQGGLIATLRYDIDPAQEASHLEVLEHVIVPALLGGAGICSVSVLVADRQASGYVNAEQRARGAANLVPPVVVLVEAWSDQQTFSAQVQAILAPEALARQGLDGVAQLGLYAHQLTLLSPR
jgi:hypothetical protein